jgi:hypothetical protein
MASNKTAGSRPAATLTLKDHLLALTELFGIPEKDCITKGRLEQLGPELNRLFADTGYRLSGPVFECSPGMYYEAGIYHPEQKDIAESIIYEGDTDEEGKLRKALKGSRYRLLSLWAKYDETLYINFAPRYGIAGFRRRLVEIKMKIRAIRRKFLRDTFNPDEISYP